VIKSGLNTISATKLEAQASAECRPGASTATLSTSGAVATLTVNGRPIAVGSTPLDVPVGLGTLHVNRTSSGGNKVSREALFLESPLGNVVVSRAEADTEGNPCGTSATTESGPNWSPDGQKIV